MTTVKRKAAVPPKRTAVAPVKPVPAMLTVSPTLALAGAKALMTGAGMKVNALALVAVPLGVVSVTTPVAPAAATRTVTVESFTTTSEVPAIPPKRTALAPKKLLPEIVIVAPAGADAGVKPVIIGAAGMKVKPARFAVPPGVRTLTLPVAPPPTAAVIVESLTTVKRPAARPPKLTASVEYKSPAKLRPVIVTVCSTVADAGEKPVMTGRGAVKVKPFSEAVPPGVTRRTAPVEPRGETTALISVGETIVNDVTAVLPKVSALTPTKPVPEIVTVSPPVAPVGEKAVITGTPAKLKPERVPVPFSVVTEISPEAPEAAGAAVMRVAETTVNEAAGTPPKLTVLAPVKFVPLMVTTSPAPATAGLNDVIAGDGINTKPASEPVP